MEDCNVKIGQNIRRVRKEKKLTQTALGNLMGKSLRQIQKYEKGISDINISVLYELAEALDISIFDLLIDNKPAIKEAATAEKKPALSGIMDFAGYLKDNPDMTCQIEVQQPDEEETTDISFSFTFTKKTR